MPEDNAEPPALLISRLNFKYPRASRSTLTDLTLSIGHNELVVLLGPSGCGKTTLSLVLAGVIPRLVPGRISGDVVFNGVSIAALDRMQHTKAFSAVFQDPESQFCTLYVEDEIAFPLENLCTPPDVMAVQVPLALKRVGLEGYERRSVYQLSGGQKQRVALASALSLSSDIIFFDSPTANLDPLGSQELLHRIVDLKGLKTVILVDDKLDEVLPLADRLVVLNRFCEVIHNDTPEAVLAEMTLADLESLGTWYPHTAEMFHRLPMRLRPVHFKVSPRAFARSVLDRIEDERMARAPEGRRPGETTHEPLNSWSGHSSTIAGVTPPPLVEVVALSYRYPGASDFALRDVNLNVPRGSFFAVAGQNGSGKTTLLNHLTGLAKPPSGTVAIDGIDVAGLNPAAVARKLSYIFQNPEHQFIANTVYEEIALGLRSRGFGPADVHAKCERMLEEFELKEVASTNPHAISGGQMRRLSVAAMLVLDPIGVLLDEPTFGQDKRTAGAIMNLLRSLNRGGKTIVMVTHDMQLVAEYADTVAVMSKGRVLWSGEPRALFVQDDLLEETALLPPPAWTMSKLLGYPQPSGALDATELVCWLESIGATTQ